MNERPPGRLSERKELLVRSGLGGALKKKEVSTSERREKSFLRASTDTTTRRAARSRWRSNSGLKKGGGRHLEHGDTVACVADPDEGIPLPEHLPGGSKVGRLHPLLPALAGLGRVGGRGSPVPAGQDEKHEGEEFTRGSRSRSDRDKGVLARR